MSAAKFLPDHEPYEGDDGDEMEPCRSCEGGEWFTECCNGSGGCSCRGQVISMGPCGVCGGSGWHRKDADPLANARSIAGYGFIGTGPRSGWDGMPRLGMRP